jgi:hypothetical protein
MPAAEMAAQFAIRFFPTTQRDGLARQSRLQLETVCEPIDRKTAQIAQIDGRGGTEIAIQKFYLIQCKRLHTLNRLLGYRLNRGGCRFCGGFGDVWAEGAHGRSDQGGGESGCRPFEKSPAMVVFILHGTPESDGCHRLLCRRCCVCTHQYTFIVP